MFGFSTELINKGEFIHRRKILMLTFRALVFVRSITYCAFKKKKTFTDLPSFAAGCNSFHKEIALT